MIGCKTELNTELHCWLGVASRSTDHHSKRSLSSPRRAISSIGTRKSHRLILYFYLNTASIHNHLECYFTVASWGQHRNIELFRVNPVSFDSVVIDFNTKAWIVGYFENTASRIEGFGQ